MEYAESAGHVLKVFTSHFIFFLQKCGVDAPKIDCWTFFKEMGTVEIA